MLLQTAVVKGLVAIWRSRPAGDPARVPWVRGADLNLSGFSATRGAPQELVQGSDASSRTVWLRSVEVPVARRARNGFDHSVAAFRSGRGPVISSESAIMGLYLS